MAIKNVNLPRLSSLLPWVPGGVVFVAAVSLARLDPRAIRLQEWIAVYPWITFGLGLLLAWRFHRSRLVASILALALAERVLALAAGAAGSRGATTVDAVVLLLPLTLALLATMHDRGVLTARGLGQILLVLIQVPLLVAALRFWPQALSRLQAAVTTGLPAEPGLMRSPVTLVWTGCGALVLSLALLRRRAVEAGLAWAVAAVFMALHQTPGSALASHYLAAAAAILAVSVVETSYAMAYRDELTGLAGRRALRAAMEELGRRYVIAMVDVDHFKRFNDRYGHDVGDQVLRMVARRLSDGGRAFRYGGEEFALIFPNRTRQEVLPVVEALRGDIATSAFVLRGPSRPRRKPQKPGRKKRRRRLRPARRLSVTVSIGVAEPSKRYKTPEEVLRAADRALYRAKSAGRNQVSK